MNRSSSVGPGFVILGGLLVALGIAAFALSGAASPTALIPAFVGLVASIPLGLFFDFVPWLLPGLMVHGTALGYLAFSKGVRRAFR